MDALWILLPVSYPPILDTQRLVLYHKVIQFLVAWSSGTLFRIPGDLSFGESRTGPIFSLDKFFLKPPWTNTILPSNIFKAFGFFLAFLGYHLSSSRAIGERVQVRWYPHNKKPIWRFGEVAKILGQLHYIILLDEEFNIKRHINQIRRTKVQKKQKKRVSFSEDVPKHDPTLYCDVPPELMMMVPYTPDRVGNQDVIADPEEQPAIENEETPPAEVRRSERPMRQPTYLSDYVQ
ncbi:hypothetical protein ILUMI_23428 [Ignelater luminosus]|uniref:Uncharacterized protein n=1 Tax=Ignelater luminosus TaxID=2038154 RepID=A0A8K0G1X4_IGNLU|nr:hypothetical protein ILUMI_23428 [Ignelater luminosus]